MAWSTSIDKEFDKITDLEKEASDTRVPEGTKNDMLVTLSNMRETMKTAKAALESAVPSDEDGAKQKLAAAQTIVNEFRTTERSWKSLKAIFIKKKK